MIYIVSLNIHVKVEAPNPRIAEEIAFKQGDELRKSRDAIVTASQCLRPA